MFTDEEGWDCVMDRQDGWVKTRMKAEQREEGEHLGGRFSPRGWEDGGAQGCQERVRNRFCLQNKSSVKAGGVSAVGCPQSMGQQTGET